MKDKLLKQSDTKIIEDIFYNTVLESEFDFFTERFLKSTNAYNTYCESLSSDFRFTLEDVVTQYICDGISNGFVMGFKYATALVLCSVNA